MRRRFFIDGFEGSSAKLTGDAAHHLARVLRAQPGQLFELSDGESLWLAETESVGREEIHFSLVKRIPVQPAPLRIALLLAIVKFDRMEWAIEKATELGVDEIVPLAAGRSEHGLIAAAAKRAERWRRILAESAQQARRLRIPLLCEAAKPRDAFAAASAQVRLMLSERSGATPMRALLEPAAAQAATAQPAETLPNPVIPSEARNPSSIETWERSDSSANIASRDDEIANFSAHSRLVHWNGPTSVAIAIGPEGGWTDAEFSIAASSGFSEAALGANIMRTETAVCAALAAVQYAFGAFRPGADAGNFASELREENT